MFDASAEFYDLIYSGIRNYAEEAVLIAELLARERPQCREVLDVGCGTGEHARRLAAKGFRVDGLDLNPTFVRIAQTKHPMGRFCAADMCDFHLTHRYDAVLCLFSSIGYLRTLNAVVRALACFREHLARDGVIVVEPWFPPGVLDPTHVATKSGEANGVQVTRTSRVEVDGALSRLHFDYTIVQGVDTRRVSEVHELGLFTTPELLEAFRRARLDATYDPKGLTGRGLYIARATDAGGPRRGEVDAGHGGTR